MAARPFSPRSMLLCFQLFGKAMPAGFAPHMQKLVGSKPNCRGRCVAGVDEIEGFDLMVDVLNAGPRCAHQRNGVMDRIDAHQWNVTDPVADAGFWRQKRSFAVYD